jgi:hypothetical protein
MFLDEGVQFSFAFGESGYASVDICVLEDKFGEAKKKQKKQKLQLKKETSKSSFNSSYFATVEKATFLPPNTLQLKVRVTLFLYRLPFAPKQKTHIWCT